MNFKHFPIKIKDGEVSLRLVETENERKTYRRILNLFHYKPFACVPGRRINWIILVDNQPCGVIGIASSPFNVGCRDKFIGWDLEKKKRNINKIANNYRFCVLIRGFGTKILSELIKEAKKEWKQKYGDYLALLDTFVEPPFKGTVYRAGSWIFVGKTKGYDIKRPPSKALLSKVLDGSEGEAHRRRAELMLKNPKEAIKRFPYLKEEVSKGGKEKLVFVKPLRANWRKHLLR